MTGLILKDVYTILKQAKLFLLVAMIMLLVQNDFMLSYIICYAAMLPITALGYDERAKWNKLADMLPYTITELVGSKYIIGYLSIGAAALTAVVFKCFYILIGKSSFSQDYWIIFCLIICAALMIQAVTLPLMFWLGVERGRLLFIIVVVAAAFVFSTVILDNLNTARQVSPFLLLSLALTVTFILQLISFGISKIAYRHSC